MYFFWFHTHPLLVLAAAYAVEVESSGALGTRKIGNFV